MQYGISADQEEVRREGQVTSYDDNLRESLPETHGLDRLRIKTGSLMKEIKCVSITHKGVKDFRLISNEWGGVLFL